MPAGLSMLDRKLLRDLWEMKGQSIAIAAVVAAGAAMFVTYLSNFDSLQRTRTIYYETARFADVFASLKRAPASVESRIAAIPGVEVVAGAGSIQCAPTRCSPARCSAKRTVSIRAIVSRRSSTAGGDG
jgi:hypothetical protein